METVKIDCRCKDCEHSEIKGDGVGNDNIIECDSYASKNEEWGK